MTTRVQTKQKGYIKILFLLLIVPIAVAFLWPQKYSSESEGGTLNTESPYCRPEVSENASGQYTFFDSSPAVRAPLYSTDNVRNIDPSSVQTWYRRIKSNVPMLAELFSGGRDCDETRQVCDVSGESKHFQMYPLPLGERKVGEKRYIIYFPIGEVGQLKSWEFPTETGGNTYLDFEQHHLLFLVQLEDSGSFAKMDELTDCTAKTGDPNFPEGGPAFGDLPNNRAKMWYVDIYQQANTNADGSAGNTPVQPIPLGVLQCKDVEEGVRCPVPSQSQPVSSGNSNNNPSVDRKQLQLETFPISIAGKVSMRSWYSPQCKPAVYLYPEKETSVHVQVNTMGQLTYADPLYPEGGWRVSAKPNGEIVYHNKTYPYLYYESKILDSDIKIPEEGFVKRYEDLEFFYQTLLPKLGLNSGEQKEFISYWKKALPYSPYYFVGIMSQSSIDGMEPLTISPKPATMIRVRLYFKALLEPVFVKEPDFNSISERNGFTVVEWGGMVKTDKDHPFTCSQ